MGLADRLFGFLRQRKKPETLQSLDQSLQAIESSKGNASIATVEPSFYPQPPAHEPLTLHTQSTLLKPAEIDESSFKLGVASGYTGRSIRSVEDALNRIESQMVTKDWFAVEYEDKTPDLMIELQNLHQEMEIHEKNEQKRFEIIQNMLERMKNIANLAPNDVKFQLLDQIRAVESQLPMTKKMEELMETIRNNEGQISYDDLAIKLNITVSALRGLLSNTLQRTSKIERYMVDGKGWVRYKQA